MHKMLRNKDAAVRALLKIEKMKVNKKLRCWFILQDNTKNSK